MKGWSLLELVVVVAIVAILAAYAVPTYRDHVRAAYRADAVAALYRAALYAERSVDEIDGKLPDGSTNGMTLPPGLDRAPNEGRPVYRVSVRSAESEGDYVLDAQPLPEGPMAADAECGTFRLYANGRRANQTDRELTDAEVARCWGRR